MTHFFVEPEVAGGWGANTVADRQAGVPVIVTRLHYEFDGWLGDQLLESTPCFIATKSLAEGFERAGLTGFQLDDVEVSQSSQFRELYGERSLPEFVWLKVTGEACVDDLGLTTDLRLVVSQRALSRLQEAGITQAVVTPITV